MSDECTRKRSRRGPLGAAVLVAALVATAACIDAAAADPPPASEKERPVTLERVAGSPVKRVILSAKAAQRIDVQLGTVGEQAIPRTQVVGAIVVDPSAGGGTTHAASNPDTRNGGTKGAELWVRLALSPPEWERLAKDKPARLFPLETRAGLPADLRAMPTGRPPVETVKSGMMSVFYVVPSNTPGLVLGDRVRAELQFEGGAEAQKVVPYSAVYYDATGDAWVYVNTAPLTFVRERITVERVAGERAILSSGPDVGTRVATVGVSLLYGAEVFGK